MANGEEGSSGGDVSPIDDNNELGSMIEQQIRDLSEASFQDSEPHANDSDTDTQDPEIPPETVHKGKKKSVHKSLPPEILESVLYLVDPETFASLTLVDHTWREAAQTPQLYAHQLSRCPTYSLKSSTVDALASQNLQELKQKFAQEVKRNLFEAYLQPRRTLVSLVSTATSSSTAFPRGEAFDFVFSANGQWTLALSSSRIYCIDTASPVVSVKRELKVPRRPLSACILNDGSILAVLSSNQHVYVYNLAGGNINHLRSISLEHRAHSIALTAGGEVVALAFDGGVELYSLSEGSGRIIKCERVDNLSFSHDSSILMGTTRNSKNPNTVILTAPYLTDDNMELPAAERISHMWTSQIVFPNSTRDCSHAALLPNCLDGDASWIFTYDRVFESYRAVRADDLRNGTTYFTGPKRSRRRRGSRGPRRVLIPCTLPAANQHGDLVASAFSGQDVWLYGMPEGFDHQLEGGPSDPPPGPARSMSKGEASELRRLPKWQVLVDKYRNIFAKGRRIAQVPGASVISWVARDAGEEGLRERLVIAAPGGILGDPELEQDDFATVDGGRLVILDFDRKPTPDETESLTFEVGHAEPELLKEESVDLETEVALARSRTVRRENLNRRTVAGVLLPVDDIPVPDMPGPSMAESSKRRSVNRSSSSPGVTLQEATQSFEGPYSHTQPRSRESIYRSATAVAANRERNPPRIVSEARIEYRRPGNRRELPHESDADNWVPPPPPYAPKADVPLPVELERTLLQTPKANDAPAQRPTAGRVQPRRANTMHESSTFPRRISSLPAEAPSLPRTQTVRAVSSPSPPAQGSPMRSPLGSYHTQDPAQSVTKRPSSSSPSRRRPVSEYVGRVTGSLRRPKISRPGSAENVPPVPEIPQTFSARSSIPERRDPHPSAIAMPSAQQLANLENRARKPPPKPVLPAAARNSIHQSSLSPGSIMPAPPRGALGAAGNAGPSIAQQPPTVFQFEPSTKQRRTLSAIYNSSARSSPALLRPAPKRLDTIESISSFASRRRSQSRELESRGNNTTVPPTAPLSSSTDTGLGRRRSQSAGPALRLDRVQTSSDIPTDRKRSFFSTSSRMKRGPGKGAGPEPAGSDFDPKGSKCVLM